MKRIICLSSLFILSGYAYAQILGYPEEIKTLAITSSMHTVDPKNEEQDFWEKIYADIPGGRIVSYLYAGAEKPGEDALPTRKSYMLPDVWTNVSHKDKRVFLSAPSPRSIDTFSLIYAGRFYYGNLLADAVQSASDRIVTVQDKRVLIAEIGLPEPSLAGVPTPATLELDAQNRVLQIIDPHQGQMRRHSFEWSHFDIPYFDYVSKSSYEITNAKFGVKGIQTVEEIQINIEIPESLFTVEHPADYQVTDLRQLLSAPNPLPTKPLLRMYN